MAEPSDHQRLLDLTGEIVAACAGSQTRSASDLPPLIASVFAALRTAGKPDGDGKPAEVLVPAVPVRKSVQPEFLVCLEDGKRVKMLKRYLQSRHGMTPADYRRRWGLAADYPMVAPAYAARRSALAKQLGLGRKAVAAPAPEPALEPPAATKPPRRRVAGRRRAL
jgi:predicted transcriptional regulator